MAKAKLNASQQSSTESSSQKVRCSGSVDNGSLKFSPNPQEERVQKTAFFTVLSYCLLIIFLPIVGFFSSKYLLFDSVFQLTSTQSNIYSAVVAVVALHLALFLYIYKAYFETESTDKRTKKD